MSRVQIDLPDKFPFETELTVRVGDLNYGNHLGNDAVLALVHEARRRYLRALGLEEIGRDGLGFVIADAAVVYRAQAFYGDRLRIQVAAQDLTHRSCAFLYRVSRVDDGVDVAHARTGVVCFDFHGQKAVAMPEEMRKRLGGGLNP